MKKNTLANKIRSALGKHYGVGWMHAMGYKCLKYKEDSYSVHKYLDQTRTKSRAIGVYKFENLAMAIIDGGSNGRSILAQIEQENKKKMNFSFASENNKVYHDEVERDNELNMYKKTYFIPVTGVSK